MVQCPIIFHMCATDPSLFHVHYSKLLNSGFNARSPLLVGLAYVDFTAPRSKKGYVAEHLSLFHSLARSPPPYPRVWMDLKPYSETDVFFTSQNLSVLQFDLEVQDLETEIHPLLPCRKFLSTHETSSSGSK